MPTPTAIAREAERSIATAGAESIDVLIFLDHVLRRAAAHLTRRNEQVPELAAVEITPTEIILHLRTPAEAPQPWSTSHDRHTWSLNRTTELDAVGPDPIDDPSPWPLLVTIGSTIGGSVWLLNLEGQAISVTGDAHKAKDFARYVAAEILCNPWSRHTTLDLLGIGGELAQIDPERTSCPDDFAGVASEAVATAVNTVTRLDMTGDRDAPTARAASTDPDAWDSRLVIAAVAVGIDELGQFEKLVASHGARTGSALLVTNHRADHGTEIVVDAIGRLTAPAMDLRLDGVGMTASEAAGCATLLTYFDATVDEPAPDLEGDDPWDDLMTTTGALRDEYRIREVTKATSDTIEGLAEQLDLDPEKLARTVREYNEACQGGDYNPSILDGVGTRGITPPKSHWALPINEPPYEAYVCTTGITFTFGGLQINTSGEVQDMTDQSIPGLYAAGELVGGLFYENYPGGTGLMSGSVFGKLAGESAAAYVGASSGNVQKVS